MPGGPAAIQPLRTQQSQAARERIRTKTRAHDYTKDLHFLGRGTLAQRLS